MTRKMLLSLVAGAAFALVAAVPAAAQTPDQNPAPASTTPNFQVNGTFMSDSQADTVSTDFTTSDDQAQPKTHTMGDRQIFLRVQGGLVFCCSNTGFVIGAGASAQPKTMRNVEVTGDFSFGRLYSENFIYFSVNGLYDIHLQNQQVMPYVGGGLGVEHTVSGGTNTGLQIMGGLQLPINGPRVVRVEVRFLFVTQTVTLVLGSITF